MPPITLTVDMAQRQRIQIGATGLAGLAQEIRMVLATRKGSVPLDSSSVDLRALPAVTFAPLSAADIEASILTTYEGLTGVSLQPGDPVRLFLEALAYVVSVQNRLLNLAGQQGLLAYAQGAHLDHLGALMGVARIPAQSARLSLRFVLGEPLGFAVPIPEGTRVATKDGQIAFATVSDSEIAAGELQVDVAALCTTSGAQATGLVPGQVTQLVDPIPYVVSVSNTTTSVEGADIEDDERLRERIRLAPETYTVAGSTGAYEARVLAVSADIEAVSDETVRPLTDRVDVAAPETVDYAVSGRWYLRRSDAVLLSGVTAAVAQAVEDWRLWQRSQPGRDINPTRLIAAVQAAGAKRVELDAPAFRALEATQVARETDISLLFGGLEDE